MSRDPEFRAKALKNKYIYQKFPLCLVLIALLLQHARIRTFWTICNALDRTILDDCVCVDSRTSEYPN